MCIKKKIQTQDNELSAVAFMLRNPLGIFVIFLGIAVAVFLIVYPHYHRPWIFSSLAPSAPAEPADNFEPIE